MRKPKKLLNHPADVCQQQLEGLIAASHGDMQKIAGISAVVRKDLNHGQVLIVTGGGSGHEPMFAGYVGDGLADAAVLGEIFTSPAPDAIMATVKHTRPGKGVLFIYGNYAGDNMNFAIAAELLEEDGITSRSVRVNDDIASAPADRQQDRRGVAGDMMVLKIAGAAARLGLALEEVWRLAEKARQHTRSIGVALSPCSLPQTGKFTFTLAQDEFELGIGVHGEPGVRRQKMVPADQLVSELVESLCEDLALTAGDEICLLINNLGAATFSELLIASRKVHQLLAQRTVVVHDTLIGSYCTSQEMSGYSITFFRLDKPLKALYDAPCHSFAWRK
ncbi:dihydroxyacetone kinase subunit DhaK [Erwiniaceae bacterium BAC15a-03b]|uniref:Dihydroxyacetone kinase subunit DhaK n=1 Tax=Winslowiella arboricola TaxID=2978220 RepID=A0A9J6PTV1_9GAMM|nr:dihydroxyacetone kinase subunit DhaK [Winslowiella arboricola]MCU5773223.1 dihydroxyacetone kinase subunit DhaK [Winslowiella arboricola]MCU5779109.1 dihydroxyacetone kinase subunit DhaK [Winslowiella arboricola]